VAFIVLLAGPGVPGEQLLRTQGAANMKATGLGSKVVDLQNQLQKRLFEAIKAEKDSAALEKRLREVIDDVAAKLNDDDKKLFGSLKGQIEGQIPLMRSAWLRFFLTYDPQDTLRKVRCPVLALNGEKDVQVDAKENLPAIHKALANGGNKDFNTREMPKLNHLFQTCDSGAVAEYAQIEETFAPVALEVIGDWLARHTGR
jgi:fermentation-respiration switch protein FrsA (DUF1100 family)